MLIRSGTTYKQTVSANILTISLCCYCANGWLSFLCYVPIREDVSNLDFIQILLSGRFSVYCIYLVDLNDLCQYFMIFFSQGFVLQLQESKTAFLLHSQWSERSRVTEGSSSLPDLNHITSSIFWSPINVVLKEKKDRLESTVHQGKVWIMGKRFPGRMEAKLYQSSESVIYSRMNQKFT